MDVLSNSVLESDDDHQAKADASACRHIVRVASAAILWSGIVVNMLQAQGPGRPIIDVHIHAYPGRTGSPAYEVAPGESPDLARLRAVIANMDAHNVVLGVMGGIAEYALLAGATAPERFIVGVGFPCTDGLDPNLVQCFEDGSDWPNIQWLQAEIEAGRVGALGELYGVYYGISPQDSAWQPYYELAAASDIPVLVHADPGPPPHMRTEGCCPNFAGRYGAPGLLGPVLEEFPDLRVVLLHAFNAPAAIELMQRFPGVYVETSPMAQVPQSMVHRALRAYKDAGLIDRVVFGSDNFHGVAKSIEVIEAADFLTEAEKRGIFYDNATRLLNITPDQETRHHLR